jgi:hypothetical protein
MLLPIWFHIIVLLASLFVIMSGIMDIVPPPRGIENDPRFLTVLANRAAAIEDAGGEHRFKKRAWFKVGLGVPVLICVITNILLS